MLNNLLMLHKESENPLIIVQRWGGVFIFKYVFIQKSLSHSNHSEPSDDSGLGVFFPLNYVSNNFGDIL